MEQRHNSIIKFDLHIHSQASAYKEVSDIVENSNIDALPKLLSKLNEHEIALFSITDHNRFDLQLYKRIIQILSMPKHEFPNVKTILPGVEFDIKLDEEMGKCHVIAIFNTQYDLVKMKKINDALQKDLLEAPNDFYSKERFQKILEDINLDTILIASQRKDIQNHNGKNNSLSDTTLDIEEIIRIGYIDALEFQTPKVEGILNCNLKQINLPIPLFSGSDCHDWNSYPYHDAVNKNLDFHHTKAKMLPTFKGLLMAITSPETRFNCRINTNPIIYKDIKTHQTESIKLVNGINAIIGENGSGKTTLLNLITGCNDKHEKIIIQNNQLIVDSQVDPIKVKYIRQGEIIKKFHTNSIFTTAESENFQDFDNSKFTQSYKNFSDDILKYIKNQIENRRKKGDLPRFSISYIDYSKAKKYYINVTAAANFASEKNPHGKPLSTILKLIDGVKSLKSESYFNSYSQQIDSIISELEAILIEVQKKHNISEDTIKCKNIIVKHLRNYESIIRKNSSAYDQEIVEHGKQRQSCIDAICDYYKSVFSSVTWPEIPEPMEGASINPKQGFYFNKEATFNGICMIDSYLSKMFTKPYRNLAQIKNIDTLDELQKSIMYCSTISEIDNSWQDNLHKFIYEATKTKEYVTDENYQQIGNTLGELSLSYYKYLTQDKTEWNIFIIDQPEDNISNKNISQKLNSYFQDIRNQKQIIFATHNPLLVVNLDVDNVIFLSNQNGNLSIQDGCLEYENSNTDMLDLIAQNMDGGKETIEKRLKIYGKMH